MTGLLLRAIYPYKKPRSRIARLVWNCSALNSSMLILQQALRRASRILNSGLGVVYDRDTALRPKQLLDSKLQTLAPQQLSQLFGDSQYYQVTEALGGCRLALRDASFRRTIRNNRLRLKPLGPTDPNTGNEGVPQRGIIILFWLWVHTPVGKNIHKQQGKSDGSAPLST